MNKIISFASDFGLKDGSVGVVKGVISRIDHELQVNDISHQNTSQDIKYGSFAINESNSIHSSRCLISSS
jgi:S-adenosylmethionine hydrolase